MRTCNNCRKNLVTAIDDDLDPEIDETRFQLEIVEERRIMQGKETSVTRTVKKENYRILKGL